MFSQIFFWLLGLAMLLVAGFVIRKAILAVVHYRGLRVVTCPETKEPVGVKVDTAHAALASLTDTSELRLKACTRWPERQDCDQNCVLQIAANPDSTRYWNILVDWYKGKPCAYCGTVFGKLEWSERKPAMVDAQQNLHEWLEVLPQNLPQILETHKPVCWNCYIAQSFRRQHPDLVVERKYHYIGLK
ncbi:MAG: hypothetical protein HY231_25200 [Acidobacteria bacterium]|nr:hypothetical protein [Acidobacteriota bacterium]